MVDDSHFHLFLDNIESDDSELYEVVAVPLDDIAREETIEVGVVRLYLTETPRRIEMEALYSAQLFA